MQAYITVGLLVVNVNSYAEYGSASLFTLEPNYYIVTVQCHKVLTTSRQHVSCHKQLKQHAQTVSLCS